MEMTLKRFDIVLVDFGEVIGSEQGGLRPVLIVQNDTGNTYARTTIVMPLTSVQKNVNQPTHTIIKKGGTSNLTKDSMVLGEAIRQISEKRIKKFIGCVTDYAEQEAIKRVYLANFGI